MTLCYILGHYCDTPDTMMATIEHAQAMARNFAVSVSVSCNTVFPGSPQHIQREELGLKIHAADWDEYDISEPSISGRGFSIDDLREMRFRAGDLLHDYLATKNARLQHALREA